jgi:hypothetical protein
LSGTGHKFECGMTRAKPNNPHSGILAVSGLREVGAVAHPKRTTTIIAKMKTESIDFLLRLTFASNGDLVRVPDRCR